MTIPSLARTIITVQTDDCKKGILRQSSRARDPSSDWDRRKPISIGRPPFTLGSNTETKEVARIERPLGQHRRTQLQLNCPTAPDWHRRMVPIAKPIPPNPHNTNQLGSGTLPFPTVSLGSVMPVVPTSLQSNNSFALFSPAKSNPPLLRRGPVSERVRVWFSSESS